MMIATIAIATASCGLLVAPSHLAVVKDFYDALSLPHGEDEHPGEPACGIITKRYQRGRDNLFHSATGDQDVVNVDAADILLVRGTRRSRLREQGNPTTNDGYHNASGISDRCNKIDTVYV